MTRVEDMVPTPLGHQGCGSLRNFPGIQQGKRRRPRLRAREKSVTVGFLGCEYFTKPEITVVQATTACRVED